MILRRRIMAAHPMPEPPAPPPLPQNVIMTTDTNPDVLAICYAQGWCASPDEMTAQEAAAVTTIGIAFKNSSISHFDELRHFTALTSLSSGAFQGCSQLEVVAIPANVTAIDSYVFYNCLNMQTIYALPAVAPTVQSSAFGFSGTTSTGANHRADGTNSLYVPSGATGYTASYWASRLCNASYGGFTIIYQ